MENLKMITEQKSIEFVIENQNQWIWTFLDTSQT